MKNRIICSFNKAASTYDKSSDVQKESSEILARYLAQNTHGNFDNILEVGCGTGHLSKLLVEMYPSARIVLSDIAINMVQLCHMQKDKNVFRVACDGETLPIVRDKKIDLIISNLAFQWFENIESAILNLKDKTKFLSFSIPISGTFQSWHDAHEKLGISSGILPLYSYEELIGILEKVGNKRVHHKAMNIENILPNAHAFTKALKNIGANVSAHHYKVSELKALYSEFEKGINANYNIAFFLLEL